MKTRLWIVAALLAVSCAGCGTERWANRLGTRFTKPAVTEQQRQGDGLDCLARARATSWDAFSAIGPAGRAVMGPIVAVIEREHEECMVVRGYTITVP